jgi:hypothetical protein
VSEVNDMLIKGELFAQSHVILALISTHPDLPLLQEELLRISERHMATVLAGEQSDASIGAYRLSLERWKDWMAAGARHQEKRTTPAAPAP